MGDFKGKIDTNYWGTSIIGKACKEVQEQLNFMQKNFDCFANRIGADVKLLRGWEAPSFNGFTAMRNMESIFRNPRIEYKYVDMRDKAISLYSLATYVRDKIHSHLFDHLITIRQKEGKNWRVIGYGFSPYISHIEKPKEVIEEIITKAMNICFDRDMIYGYKMIILDGNDNLYYPKHAFTILFLKDYITY